MLSSEAHRQIQLLMTKMRRFCALAVNKRLALVGSSLHLYMVLFRLVHDEEVPQNELAIDAAIDPAAASRLIREMSGDGLVTTRVDPADKRQRFVQVTAKGRALERTLCQIVDSALEPYMVGLTEAEETEFIRLLRKAHDAVLEVAMKEESAKDAPVRAKAGGSRKRAVAAGSSACAAPVQTSPRSRSIR